MLRLAENENRNCESIQPPPGLEGIIPDSLGMQCNADSERPCKGTSISPSSSSSDLQESTTEGEQGLPGSPESTFSTNSSHHSVDSKAETESDGEKDDASEESDDDAPKMRARAVSEDSSYDSSEDSGSDSEDEEDYDWFEELTLECAHEEEEEDEEEETEGVDTDTVKLPTGAKIGLATPEIELPLRERLTADPECDWYRTAFKHARRPPWRFKCKSRSPTGPCAKGEVGSGPIFFYLQRRYSEGADVLAGPVEIPNPWECSA